MPPKKKTKLAYEPPVTTFRTALTLYVNGVKKEVKDALPTMNLLEYLRSIGLTGTKLGCGEGGRGACTVMLSSFENGAVRHAAVNAWYARTQIKIKLAPPPLANLL